MLEPHFLTLHGQLNYPNRTYIVITTLIEHTLSKRSDTQQHHYTGSIHVVTVLINSIKTTKEVLLVADLTFG